LDKSLLFWSLILIFAFWGIISYFLAVISDLIKTQRQLSEEIIYQIKTLNKNIAD